MNIFDKYPKFSIVKPDYSNWECDHGVTIPNPGNSLDYCHKCKVEWEEEDRRVEQDCAGKPFDEDSMPADLAAEYLKHLNLKGDKND